MTDIEKRKAEHVDIVLQRDVRPGMLTTGFERIAFENVALPELDLDGIDLSTAFLGRELAAPLLVSSMTGGHARAAGINRAIAEAAGAARVGLAVGSQRVALEGASGAGLDRSLRRAAGPVPILANLGAAQLRGETGLAMALRAVEMIDADALIIHLNPLQEALQHGGDRDWTGLLARIELLARDLGRPLVVKEIGCGISGRLARRLRDAGVTIIDVAGAGGTSWAAVEAERAPTPRLAAVANAFRDWGIPTAAALSDVRAACPDATVIASGGIRDGVDAAKAIRLGADLVAQAAGILPAAIEGTEAVLAHLGILIDQLRISCFCTGSRDLRALRTARLCSPVVLG